MGHVRDDGRPDALVRAAYAVGKVTAALALVALVFGATALVVTAARLLLNVVG